MGARPTEDSFAKKLTTIVVLTGIFFLNFISRIILAPLLPAIEVELGLNHTQAGSLFFLISAGYFVALTGSGFLAAKLRHRRTILVCAAILTAALFWLSQGRSLTSISLALVLLGLGTGIYLPSAMALITSLVKPKNWGKALAIHEIAPNLAMILAPVIAEAFLSWSDWRTMFLALAAASVLTGGAFALWGRGGDFPGQPPSPSVVVGLLRKPSLWIMMAVFSLGAGSEMGVYSMLPLYLVTECSFDRGLANTLLGLSRFSGLILVFASGLIIDRVGLKKSLTFLLVTTGLATVLLGSLSGLGLTVILFFQASLTSCIFPPALAGLARIGRPEERNVTVSLAIPLAFVFGGGIVPMAIGFMGQQRSFAPGFIMVGALIMLGSILTLYIKFADQEK